MWLTIQNDHLSLSVNTLGAEMMSLRSVDGTEYLWQGDPKYWSDRAINLFPFIGRLTNNSYCLRETQYPMSIHGFAWTSEFAVVEKMTDRLILELSDNEETRKQYPFAFSFRITYVLKNDKVEITLSVENRSETVMPFGVGGHPGFNVPLVEGEQFEDYSITFSQICFPDRVGFTPAVYMSGYDERYLLEDDVLIRLRHDLFDDDAIILKNMAREVTLKSDKCGKGVKVTYPDLGYLGIWHMPKTDAPYVCIEPWSSLPSRQDVVEDLYCKSDMIQLPANKIYETAWSITVL